MCGIAGIVAADDGVVRRALASMDTAQRHRGPDGHGQFFERFGETTLGLGHRRLAILDLSSLGHQPMVHPQTGDVIVFNGEIYNFRALRHELEFQGEQFASTGDTEVLLRGLARHGERFLERLQGMFAFGFLCRRTRRVLLARDPLGIKPLYYTARPGLFAFASEVRAISSTGLVDQTIDSAALSGFLALGAVQQPRTIFRDICMLMPGHWAWLDLDTASLSPSTAYWRFPEIISEITELEASDGLRHLLDEAVRNHLESDVPVGVCLSSGIDSTAVAGLARRHSDQVRSFTVGFDDHKDFSEATLAAETAATFGLDHTSVTINSDDAAALAVDWLASLDQPSMDGLNVFIISKVVRDHGITVALTGLGGDELFAGYPSFVDVPFFAKTVPWMRWLPQQTRDWLARGLSGSRSLAYQQKLRSIFRSDGSIPTLYFLRRRFMSDDQLESLGSDPALASTESLLQSQVANVMQLVPDDIASISRLESMIYQGNMLLRDSDTNGMAHGLEIRVPMLDTRVVELASRIPGRVRFPKRTVPKQLLRKAFTDTLRPQILNQPKMGFTLPIRPWMLGPLRDLCEDAIAFLKTAEVLDPRGIDSVWKDFIAQPESPMWSRAFTLVVLGRYLSRVLPSRDPAAT